MPAFTRDHVFILPHAEEYRQLYALSVSDLLTCLNSPDMREGLATDHFTAEKQLSGQRIYVYYYLTYPLQGKRDEVYAIVDFIGYAGIDDQPNGKQKPEGTTVPSSQG